MTCPSQPSGGVGASSREPEPQPWPSPCPYTDLKGPVTSCMVRPLPKAPDTQFWVLGLGLGGRRCKKLGVCVCVCVCARALPLPRP